MYLLHTLPSLEDHLTKLPPKALVEGCNETLENLQIRINSHYSIGDVDLAKWNCFFKDSIPEDEARIDLYMKTHRYICPLASYFKERNQYCPSWTPPVPACSFSIFPAHVVVAMPSVQCQFIAAGR